MLQNQVLLSDMDPVQALVGGLSACLADVGHVQKTANQGVPGQTGSNGSVGSGSHVITTSIDEGVEVDFERDSDCSSVTSSITSHHSQPANASSITDSATGLTRSNVFGDLSQLAGSMGVNTSDQSLSTGMGSPFASFDSNIEADLMSSQSSCAPSCSYSSSTSTPTCNPGNQYSTITATMTPPITSKFSHNHTHNHVRDNTVEEFHDDRSDNGSPVSFREGRRASDGLMSQGIIAFRQRLKESMKTRGVAELRKEMEDLQTQCKVMSPEEVRHLQVQHYQYQEKSHLRQWSLEETTSTDRPKLTTKRKSLPSPGQLHLEMAPHKLLAIKHSLHVERQFEGPGDLPTITPIPGFYGLKGDYQLNQLLKQPLQHHLLHHRLQQKRQVFQKQSQQPMGPMPLQQMGPQPMGQQSQQQLQQMGQQSQQLQQISQQQQQQQQPPEQQLPMGQQLQLMLQQMHIDPTQQQQQQHPPQQLQPQQPQLQQQQQVVAVQPPFPGQLPILDQQDLAELDPKCGNGSVLLPAGAPGVGIGQGDALGPEEEQLLQAIQQHQQQQQQQQQLVGQGGVTVTLPPTLIPQHQFPLALRRHMLRQTSYKLAQQQPVVMPTSYVDPDQRLPWQHCENPPLSPMFEEETNENDEVINREGDDDGGDGDRRNHSNETHNGASDVTMET